MRHEPHEVLPQVLKLLERADVLKEHHRSELHPGLGADGCGGEQCRCHAAVVALDDDFQVDHRLLAHCAGRRQLVFRQCSTVRVLQVIGPRGIVSARDPPEHTFSRRIPEHLSV